ncbi:phosphatase PAP2 family protein [Streptomyces sp. NPDC058067]|uniref:phosphatase PAP2 family protein n=1 Tax=Streptomyces sp. NPDC058067 TaxID=3346324 RepID=UPI0036E78D31
MTAGSGSRGGAWRERRGSLLVAALCALLFVALTTVVLVRHGQPLPGDAAIHDWARRHRPPVALALGRAVTATGTGVWPYLLAALAGAFAGRAAHRWLRGALLALAVLVAGQLIRTGLMELIDRARPVRHDWATHASGFSFPSGHATTSAIVAGLLCWAARRAVTRAVVLCWAVAVGLTRIELGVHWPTDVAAGWLLAATWLLTLRALSPHPIAPASPGDPDAPEAPDAPGAPDTPEGSAPDVPRPPTPRRIRRVTPLPPRATRRQTGPASGEPELLFPVPRGWFVPLRPR